MSKLADVRVNLYGEMVNPTRKMIDPNFLIPLPPLEEQKRIVEKIKEMLPYCQQLIK